ncbi:hypothetical protein NCI00_20495 [Runella sp. S5]|uniref:Uncharacterized protein n=1 Tax=Runella salmonicolor TaxID=2950278 RepID=A0ABT1FWI1_9BACT|nr:hypothetical protein [Runella salmonicolor]
MFITHPETLREVAVSQLKSLSTSKDAEHLLAEGPNKKKEPKTSFDETLKGLLNVPPPKKEEK